MNTLLKFKETPECKVFFTSDLHWNHSPKWSVPIWESRGYSSVTESNESIISIINSCVRPSDILFNLGDMTLNCTEEQFEYLIGSLQCQNIYSLWGNHNSPSWHIYKREISMWASVHHIPEPVEAYPFRYKNVIFVGNYAEIVVNGTIIVLSHYAPQVWNHSGNGGWCLVGHSHGNLPTILPDAKCGKILDVGFDVFKSPVSFTDVRRIMDSKPVASVDHH